MDIQIQVRNKVAVNLTPGNVIVCGNSGYVIAFDFDAEWENEAVKTARFVYRKDGKNLYEEVAFTGTTANVPVLSGINHVMVGVYAGNLRTTTPAFVECDKSILCGGGVHKEPTPDVYNQLITLIEDGCVAGEDGGYYTPKVTQVDGNTMKIAFTPSKEGMEAIADKVIMLPAGKDGAKGEDGADGKDGADGYTPVKGVDYWTQDEIEEVLAYINAVAGKKSSPTSINLSSFESEGKIVETFADGSTKTTVMEFDADGKPAKITDGDGNVTVLTW